MLNEKLRQFRFILIQADNPSDKKQGKCPLEKNWQKGKSYGFDDIEAFNHPKCGLIIGNDHIVIDFDNQILGESQIPNLTKTFTVKTAKGYHLYYRVSGMKHRDLRLFGFHIGEIRTGNHYVIAPGSTVNNNVYTVIDDSPIATVDADYILKSLSRYLPGKTKSKKPRNCFSDAINNNTQMTGTEGHAFRTALACELRGCGATELETISFFINQDDFDYDITAKQVNAVYEKDLKPFMCSTLLEQCPTYVDCSSCKCSQDSNDKKQEANEVETDTIEEPTDDELKILTNQSLLLKLIKEIHDTGLGGEDDTILVHIIKVSLRLVLNAKATSSNLLVSDNSGGGKDCVVEKVCNVLVPKKRYLHLTDVSEKALLYASDENDWHGMVLHLEDVTEDLLNSSIMKTFSSGGLEGLTTIDQKTKYIKVEGKPVIIATSEKQVLDNELCRRWDLCHVDTSVALTTLSEGISVDNAEKGPIATQYGITTQAIQKLKPYSVVIPDISKIKKYLPTHLAMRTQIEKLLDFIKASAIVHQYDRTINANGYLEATHCDIICGLYCFNHLKSHNAMPLTNAEQELINILFEGSKTGMTKKEIKMKDRQYLKDHHIDNRTINGNMGFLDKLENKEVIRLCPVLDKDLGYEVKGIKLIDGNAPKTWSSFSDSIVADFGYCEMFDELQRMINNTRKDLHLKPIATLELKKPNKKSSEQTAKKTPEQRAMEKYGIDLETD